MSETTTTMARFAAITFDCSDAAAMGEFYGKALGMAVYFANDEFVALGKEGGPMLCFHQIATYQRPTWPEQGTEKQAHLELSVTDLDAAEAEFVALGAVKADTQPSPERWRVLLDPAGHPFCLTTMV